jgi:hypothetical protein
MKFLMTKPVIEHVLSPLRVIGVTDLFGVPGDYAFTINDAICDDREMRWVGCCKELNAAYAADGWRKRSLLLHRLRLHSLLLADLPVLRSLFPLWPQQQMRWMAPAHGI